MVMQAARAQQIASKDGRGARGDDLRRAGRGRVYQDIPFSCTPHPHHPGGSGKTGARSATTLYVSIHSPSRVPGNILQDFEALAAAWTVCRGVEANDGISCRAFAEPLRGLDDNHGLM
jgi:hypothetical protein